MWTRIPSAADATASNIFGADRRPNGITMSMKNLDQPNLAKKVAVILMNIHIAVTSILARRATRSAVSSAAEKVSTTVGCSEAEQIMEKREPS